ncbi:MAG: YraN family protein [Gammaproteobacteria bacterium]|nr:YraN family protein [Gammaproteobacteria bacterium]
MSILPTPPNTRSRQQQGAHAEELACRFLQRQGLRLVARNYRCRQGEIDLIMQDRDNLVFVEVRYRRQSRYGSGLESVTPRKQRRIVHCAAHYLHCHPQAAQRAARFDVVALRPDNNGELIDTGIDPGIEWVRNAFDAF